MSKRSALETFAKGGAWWETEISDIRKNEIVIRGQRVEELIGEKTYSQMLVFLLCGKELTDRQARLLDSVLVAGADHGPRAPSIAAARMAATCGVTFNSAVATGINMLGDIHGGAVEGAMVLLYETAEAGDVAEKIDAILAKGEKLPGFGHQLHDQDPRVKRLYQLAEPLISEGEISGKYLKTLEACRQFLSKRKKRPITVNIDGVSAAIQCELALPYEAAKGIFALSRGMGIVAHAYEEVKKGTLIKGPCPNEEHLVRYTGLKAKRSAQT
ncbi:citrate synthase [Niallia circulans]|jgi:citrate synthase|uniref:citryl-CoA lyase n=1 Tax=Shouchella clausii TaxID=79880 RepID=UPI000BA7CB17|nr:citryl-CoA lyase [Shouchella clausii]SPU17694.1 citrate synthase [Niallia circulans]MBU8595884.1 citryl-CoA lyase [Shouchella clausii]MCM3548381.1 citryl-CoA lyase [Shouchella clausii]MCY1103064.1 citryl-CoA lyase [Shouchella clausii]MEB5478046.1 citryl-CoA lyase [Shouchella clausii]